MTYPRTLIGAALAVLAPAFVTGVSNAQLDPKYDPKKLSTPALRRVQTVTPERLVLKNGMIVFLLENHDLPVVTGQANVRTTPSWIPDDKVGLGSVTGQVIRSGGSARHPGDALDDRLAAIGASIGTSIGPDIASASFRCLSDNTGEVLGLLADILRDPAFPDDKIELARVGLRRAIAGRNDEMLQMLFRVSTEAAYGKGSPYARKPEYATVEAIHREDCVKLHAQVYEPGRMVLAVYGDFKSADMKQLLATTLGGWKGAGGPAPVLPPPPAAGRAHLMFAPKEDVTQSGIVLTHLGFRADDPDYPAMDVFQTALGGGFQSRLVNRIRTERGLAYGTGARAGEDYQRPGVFVAYCLTRSDSTLVALGLLRDEVRKSTEAPFTAEELQRAKESVQNQFVFNFEQPSDVLFRAGYFETIGYPQDFLERYQKGLETVTAASVLDAAKRKVHPDQLVAVVVGKEKDFDGPLTAVGLPVERVDISIPSPPSKLAVGAATPEALAQGREWLKRAAELAGGSGAWAAIRTVSLEEEQQISMQGQSVSLQATTSWALPDRRRVVRRLPMGEMIEGSDGKTGWNSMMSQVQDQPAALDNVRQSWERSLYRLFGHPEDVQIQALAEPQSVDGTPYRVAFVKSDAVKEWTVAFAPDGRLARMEYQAKGQAGPAKATVTFSDWHAEGALQIPHGTVVLMDGKPFVDSKLTAVHFNAVLPDSLFRKPNP
jgi:zinc protease